MFGKALVDSIHHGLHKQAELTKIHGKSADRVVVSTSLCLKLGLLVWCHCDLTCDIAGAADAFDYNLPCGVYTNMTLWHSTHVMWWQM